MIKTKSHDNECTGKMSAHVLLQTKICADKNMHTSLISHIIYKKGIREIILKSLGYINYIYKLKNYKYEKVFVSLSLIHI